MESLSRSVFGYRAAFSQLSVFVSRHGTSRSSLKEGIEPVASVRLKLLEEHGREAERQGAKFYDFGWVTNEHSIMSKTSRGYLDSEINPDTMEVTHQWTPYNDSAVDERQRSR